MGMWEHPLHKMQAGLALLLPLWSEPALVLPPRCADFGCGHGDCLPHPMPQFICPTSRLCDMILPVFI